ncbi:1-(5-phosphoribosyl)-5-[(5-phosphoribosylamino)methylideneamino] imidazole-4-carboxamide isomerase [Buchnera aphidicola str. Ak (Acyrthosiphon kondoi)]|uniref:1-(5-phosphoribosyl)-5-[(5-phosphoribosylamino)methylideneamino] imidazole-4-carboxamide isomerase n=1 Tax=Buchnera aphidicola str. Ak (Acyrthosiphon kondoi) TaxID=1005090 RepID=G2LMH9_9GAMM|nr:1-(5-phosphoribosyl)-5-[(5-phosphoribosylamino)methylideneamino]imidazole-4-carboxamide isomerase [Buchnera aphidicola]AEO08467.1 1-(5-phosphoribosyl)-5-[(5-phosphoribosylamino)methylideneamino] imidazole-4-carboxamide isomerase [Buchnera aphidicola str. Ak (Acyrthosiphon kondoi)]WAI18177.1 MAG: 1-(5-phosphoribosyl)-5-[(5-phosphoribosylamino)methylideneamino]imidazole-4-carboxamide isomerase [Buchnera aphidicola (Acyrthosiphon caraganae)]
MIIPAFDLINGRAVRLYQGNYLNQKHYDINLSDYLEKYKSKRIQIVHLVDLDGAKNRENRQIELFKEILSYSTIPLQIGGGIRTTKDINTLLDLGVKRVVIGSSAIHDKNKVKKWLKIYGSDAIVLALDVYINNNNQKEIYINGWQKRTNVMLEEIIEYFLPSGLKHVLCTDISKDGTLLGPNFKLYKDISSSFKNINFQASGGVATLEDIISLKKTGIKSIIIGRSLLEKKFTIEEALKCWQREL